MSLRSGHGKGRGTPHVEVMPPDELPAGVPAPPAAVPERADSRFVKGSARTAAAARAGGLAKARRNPMAAAKSLGLGQLLVGFDKDTRITPFVDDAERWMLQELDGLARDVGGGELSAGVVSIVQSAAWQRCFSQFFFDLSTRSQFAWTVTEAKVLTASDKKLLLRANTELVSTASRLAEGARQNLLAAFEMAAREAAARKQAQRDQPYDVAAALQLTDGEGRK